MDEWWDCEQLDTFFFHVLRAQLEDKIRQNWRLLSELLLVKVLNMQSRKRAFQSREKHYDSGNDLFKNFLDVLKITISKVEVCDLKHNTFYARIYFTLKDQAYNIDARPSDAIALALRADCPIFVDEKVLEKSAKLDGEPEAMDTSEEGKKWKEYLEKLSPEDFGKYKM